MVIIIGAGLSGLLTAYRLTQKGIPFKILEARDRIGGRIHTVYGANDTPMEMGATWFGDQHHHLKSLIEELEIGYYTQYNGDSYFFYQPEAPQHGKYPLSQASDSYRIHGGTSRLIKVLSESIQEEDVLLNSKVISINVVNQNVQVTTDKGVELEGKQVVVTLPPKVWASNITFHPNLPDQLLGVANNTQTWMEDSTKAAVEFDHPFWKEENKPSIIVSNTGPFIECYDHSNKEEDKYSLCGFLNPAFNQLEKEKRVEAVIHQLVDVLGEKVQDKISYKEYLWQEDTLVKSKPGIFNQPHENNGQSIFRNTYFDGKVIFSGSETASYYAGYMEGAVVSSNLAVEQVLGPMSKTK